MSWDTHKFAVQVFSVKDASFIYRTIVDRLPSYNNLGHLYSTGHHLDVRRSVDERLGDGGPCYLRVEIGVSEYYVRCHYNNEPPPRHVMYEGALEDFMEWLERCLLLGAL